MWVHLRVSSGCFLAVLSRRKRFLCADGGVLIRGMDCGWVGNRTTWNPSIPDALAHQRAGQADW